jgi:hypothetical protein
MSVIERIREKLKSYPSVEFKETADSITVLPNSNEGFEVRLDDNGETYTVSFEGWHEEFESAEEALDCFAFGLSSECRLKELRKDGSPYRWIVESKVDGSWTGDSETGLLIYALWKRSEIVYRQNRLF